MKAGWVGERSLAGLIAAGVLALGYTDVRGEAAAAPQVAFSTIDGSGGSYFAGGSVVGGSAFQGPADRFVPSVSGLLSSVQLGLRYIETPQSVQVQIRADDALGWPGAILASGIVTASTSDTFSLTSFVPANPVQLSTGTGYWAAVLPLSSDTFLAWGQSLYANGTLAMSQDGGGSWGIGPPPQRLDAFRVNVIPEPSTLALLGPGALALAMMRRRD